MKPITLNAETAARYYPGYNYYFNCSKCENYHSDSDDKKYWRYAPVEEETSGKHSEIYCAKYQREVKR